MPRSFTVATRASALAQAQALLTIQAFSCVDQSPTKTLLLTTEGDNRLEVSLMKTGGKGLFVKELEQAVLKKQADFAVHSLKDMPLVNPPGLMNAGFLEGASPYDCLISSYGSLNELPPRAVIGTSSLRRATQLKILRADLSIKLLRGNILTRLNKLDTGHYDAIILAVAGLERLNIERYYDILPEYSMTPAFNQGIIAIQCRKDDDVLVKQLQSITTPRVALRVHWERTIAQLFKATCESAFGVHAHVESMAPLKIQLTIFACCSYTLWRRKQGSFECLEQALLWAAKEFELKSIDWSLCQLEYF